MLTRLLVLALDLTMKTEEASNELPGCEVGGAPLRPRRRVYTPTLKKYVKLTGMLEWELLKNRGELRLRVLGWRVHGVADDGPHVVGQDGGRGRPPTPARMTRLWAGPPPVMMGLSTAKTPSPRGWVPTARLPRL